MTSTLLQTRESMFLLLFSFICKSKSEQEIVYLSNNQKPTVSRQDWVRLKLGTLNASDSRLWVVGTQVPELSDTTQGIVAKKLD